MPQFPRELGYVWSAYLRIRRRAAGGFSGPNPIGWQDIDAFLRLAGLRLVRWEIELIERIDDLFVHPENTRPDSTAAREMTPALFDALFS